MSNEEMIKRIEAYEKILYLFIKEIQDRGVVINSIDLIKSTSDSCIDELIGVKLNVSIKDEC